MAFVGGDVGAIRVGGEALERASGDLEHRRPGVAQLRALGVRGAGESPVAGLVERLAAALDASLADASREVGALGVLASSTAEDLDLASVTRSTRLFRGRR